jgi:Mn-containing catalase
MLYGIATEGLSQLEITGSIVGARTSPVGARAKIIYERLINARPDPGVRDALELLMTREVAHQTSCETALYAIQPNFAPGTLPGDARFTGTHFDMSRGDGGGRRSPWNPGNGRGYLWLARAEPERPRRGLCAAPDT